MHAFTIRRMYEPYLPCSFYAVTVYFSTNQPWKSFATVSSIAASISIYVEFKNRLHTLDVGGDSAWPVEWLDTSAGDVCALVPALCLGE